STHTCHSSPPFFFVLSPSGTHPSLRSFPTRRSSDLALVETLGIATERGRIVVNGDLSINGTPGLWAIGDCAQVPNERSPLTTMRSEEHTSELQSRSDLVCRLLLEKKKKSRAQNDGGG